MTYLLVGDTVRIKYDNMTEELASVLRARWELPLVSTEGLHKQWNVLAQRREAMSLGRAPDGSRLFRVEKVVQAMSACPCGVASDAGSIHRVQHSPGCSKVYAPHVLQWVTLAPIDGGIPGLDHESLSIHFVERVP